MTKKSEKKRCFVVGPIGADDSDDRIHADWLLEAIIQPVFDAHFSDFVVERADKISNPGQITTQIITALLEAELVIADLTTLNANAFYEIGIRHTIQKPIIHMFLEGQSIPFDIAAFRSIKFSRRRPSDLRVAKDTLKAFVQEAISEDHEIDNPVTFSRGKIEFAQTATPKERILEDQLAAINSRLDLMDMALGNPPNLMFMDAANHLRRVVAPRRKSLGVEIRSRGGTTREQLKTFVNTVFTGRFPEASMIEDNDTNFVFALGDTLANRARVETLRNEGGYAAFEVEILLHD
ncbi:hypothetical protein G6L85_21810 [Agrobacterium rhizogenes]|uniref:hypothetical protein n=1 Tax=Rhizobium rhizogenes TaxID=359 RepID=UPI0015747F88|nr:hypothetical protein [Rhizobium rhizogenes]NTI64155.1 hypothetical protein [Rhizobium rhizogenes]